MTKGGSRNHRPLALSVGFFFFIVSSVAVGAFLTQQSKLTATGAAAGDHFGKAVAISGSTMVSGLPNDDDKKTNSGSAAVFVRSGSSWKQQAKLLASNGAASDYFGTAVAIDGNTIVVGAPNDDDSGSNSGSAFVYVRTGSTWKQQAQLVTKSGAKNDNFGWTVSISGDVVAIGAPKDDNKGADSGAVFIFRRKVTTWTEEATLTDVGGAKNDWFGWSVALSKTSVLIGSPRDDDKGTDSGSVQVFHYNGSNWLQQAKLVASGGAANDRFGYSVDIDGDSLVVGAYQDDDRGSNSGSAFIFTRSGQTWTQRKQLTDVGGAANDYLGFSVAISKDKVLLGAYGEDPKGSSSGAAVVFVGQGATWKQDVKLVDSGGKASDFLGYAVALDGITAVCGSYGDDDGGSTSGSTSIFRLMLAGGFKCDKTVEGACKSGHCVDGLCCDTACGGGSPLDCQACSALAGAGKDGVCGAVKSGNTCRAALSTCDLAETCDGFSTTCPANKTQPDGTACDSGKGKCKAGKCVPNTTGDLGADKGATDKGGADSSKSDKGAADSNKSDKGGTDSSKSDKGGTDSSKSDKAADKAADKSTTDGAGDATGDGTSGAADPSAGGCDCRTAGDGSGAPQLGLALLMLLGWRRRRRRRADQ